MRASLRMMFIMGMVGTFIPMATTIQGIGWMGNGQAGASQQREAAKFTRGCGSIVSSWGLEDTGMQLYQDLKIEIYTFNQDLTD